MPPLAAISSDEAEKEVRSWGFSNVFTWTDRKQVPLLLRRGRGRAVAKTATKGYVVPSALAR